MGEYRKMSYASKTSTLQEVIFGGNGKNIPKDTESLEEMIKDFVTRLNEKVGSSIEVEVKHIDLCTYTSCVSREIKFPDDTDIRKKEEVHRVVDNRQDKTCALSDEMHEEIVRLFNIGVSKRGIASKLNIARSTVDKHLNRKDM